MLNVKQHNVRILRVGDVDYISLTDIAKYQNPREAAIIIVNWMSSRTSFSFYSLWEELNNQEFNFMELHKIKLSAKRFFMTPKQWKEEFNAIGIVPSAGKYSIGTFAHPDIAFEFASWLSPEFKLYLITEFQRLKKSEAYQNKIEWNIKRELAKINYLIHTEAIKENLIPTLTNKQKQLIYANEADVLNVALFGLTASDWRNNNPKLDGNIRDYASVLQLVVLVNLENLNANMIENSIPQKERLIKLNEIARRQLIKLNNNSIKRVAKMGGEDTNISEVLF